MTITNTVKVLLRSKATLGDSFCPSYKLGYNARWFAALGISALLAIIMLTSQSASANMIGGFDCFGEWHCVSGWNHALNDAQNDYNGGQYVHQQNTYRNDSLVKYNCNADVIVCAVDFIF